jgi:DNA-binding HxlR family transcriptional regulator
MNAPHRSGCPINLTVEILGDRWSLIILRDMMFGGLRHFRELLNNSQEGIASNILADRLKKLVQQGMLTKADDPTHKQKAIYSLTEAAIELLPVFAQIGAWGSKWLPVSEELSIRAILLDQGGQPMWEQFMEELRWEHLGDPIGAPKPDRTPVREQLQAAYLDVMRRKGRLPEEASV